MDIVELSRMQFALTAMIHFLFVPLTLGLAFLLAIMESVYVMTGKTIYRDMTQFWGKLFGINFALGVTTGLAMEFQFGTNWSYYSHYVGDIFGDIFESFFAGGLGGRRKCQRNDAPNDQSGQARSRPRKDMGHEWSPVVDGRGARTYSPAASSPRTSASSARRRPVPSRTSTAIISMVSAISARGTVTTLSWISCSSRRSVPSAEPA